MQLFDCGINFIIVLTRTKCQGGAKGQGAVSAAPERAGATGEKKSVLADLREGGCNRGCNRGKGICPTGRAESRFKCYS